MTKMSNMVKWLLATLLMALSLGASAAEDDNNAYVLGAGDQIRVTVYQNPDLLIETRIPEGGAISFPLLGTVQIGGLTVADAEKKIATGLKDGKFLKQPWRWPEVWRINKAEIKNPHLIYPGDIILLDYFGGSPRLKIAKPVNSRLQPKIYSAAVQQ